MPHSRSRKPPIYKPSRGIFADRTFKSKHAYRNELARTKGFRNYYEERKAYKPVTSRRGLESLSRVFQQKRADAFEVLGIMRRTGISLRPAIRQFNRENPGTPITPRTAKKYIQPGLKKQDRKWISKDRDRLVRVMRFLTKQGVDYIEVRDSRSATLIAHYWNAVLRFMLTGETDQLSQFRNRYVQSGKLHYRFITDPDLILRFADFGELRFETIYQEISAI
jgi:hypothetical protein